MKVKIVRATIAQGEAVEPGVVLDLSETEANLLISLRKAIVAPAGKTAEKAVAGKTAEKATEV